MTRHGLHRAHPIACALRLDFFLTRDEGDAIRSGAGRDLVVDLAREQAQRQSDEPGLVTQHALDRQVRLARIGGPKHGSDVADAGSEVEAHSQMSSRCDLEVPAGIAEWCDKIKGREQKYPTAVQPSKIPLAKALTRSPRQPRPPRRCRCRPLARARRTRLSPLPPS